MFDEVVVGPVNVSYGIVGAEFVLDDTGLVVFLLHPASTKKARVKVKAILLILINPPKIFGENSVCSDDEEPSVTYNDFSQNFVPPGGENCGAEHCMGAER